MKKHLILLIAAFQFAVVFFVGAAVGSVVGFDPINAGVTTMVLSSIIRMPAGSLADGLDLSLVVAELQNYLRVHSKTIWNQILKGNDFEAYMRPQSGITYEYVGTLAKRSKLLQAYQKGFQPSGGVTMNPYVNKCFHIKMDYQEEDLAKLHVTYLSWLADETKTPDQYNYIKWLVEYQIIPGITEELREMCIKGSYVAPTAGTAGISLNAATGLFTTITNEITDGNIVPITMGAITSTNIVDYVEDFHSQLPQEWKSSADPIFVSSSNLERYIRRMRAQHGQVLDVQNPVTTIYGTNKRLVGLDFLNGSDRLLFTPSGMNGNLVKMFNKLEMPTPTTQLDKRAVNILADFFRGWGFETLEFVFVNDQD